ncbi:MAG TPA: TolC family protein [Desulfomonilia bacterium]|nr:TolC family protein [Desulfomonilia bacterium]
MRKHIFSIALSFFFLGLFSAHASDYLTLEESIKTAIERNPGVKAQNQDVLGKEMDKRSQFSQMLPKVDLTYGYMRFEDVQTFTFPPPLGKVSLSSKGNYNTDIEAKQVLFAGGALYNSYLVAKNDLFSAQLERERFIRDLKLLVIDGYYAVIKSRQQREAAKSNVSSFKSHLDVANAFFNQGMIPKNDLLESQVKYAQSQQLLITADNAVKIAEANMNILLQRNLSEEVNIDSEIAMTNLETTFDQSLTTAMENRQEIKTANLQVENSAKGINIARSAFMPNVAATYGYEKQTGVDPSLKYDTWKTGIGLSWNLFSGGSSYWDYNKSRYMNRKAEYLLESLKNQVTLEVKNSYLNIEEAKARLEVAQKAIAQAEELARIQRDRYNLQVATTTDVLDAQTLLLQAQNNYITARADHARAMAALRASMGTL